jgi:NADP-dependent aldehyde dehydrogenase
MNKVQHEQAFIDRAMDNAAAAFEAYRQMMPNERANFLEAIALGLENAGEPLLILAAQETNLPLARLKAEVGRTCNQLRVYAGLLQEGSWVNALINESNPNKNPPAPDLRSMQVPMGPVVVFGASNFPFAYSTAGGDTASALAAGCSVVVKQHPAHAQTSVRVFEIIEKAARTTCMPENVVQHVPHTGNFTGEALVKHPATAAVGFTGSYAGGLALHQYAQQRKHPIPVFAEMGSVNPVFLLPQALADNGADIARQYAASITTGMGQFCTNPGLIFGICSPALTAFAGQLTEAMQQEAPMPMLHKGIEQAYLAKTRELRQSNAVHWLLGDPENSKPHANLARVSADVFLANPLLHEEVFGPFSILVACANAAEMYACQKVLEGQLTTSLMGTDADFKSFAPLIALATAKAGRLIFNGVPTGVVVADAMVHGGPAPATTDSRFTAVGPMAIYRWTRPVCWQNAPGFLLPPELKTDNPLGIWRRVNGIWER